MAGSGPAQVGEARKQGQPEGATTLAAGSVDERRRGRSKGGDGVELGICCEDEGEDGSWHQWRAPS